MSKPQDASIITIKANKGWNALNLAELWDYRELLYFLTWREVKSRYRQMALGPIWIILKPFATMVVMSLVFGKIAKIPSDGLPYPIFNYTALLPWQLFAVSLSKASTSLVTNMSMMSKVYYPRLTMPISSAASGLVDFFMAFLILVAMMIYYGVVPTWHVVFLPVFIMLALFAAMGIGLCLATLSVKFRDVKFGVEHAIQIWIYASPVVYPASMVPEAWRDIYMLNPMAWVIEGFRWSLLGKGQSPDWSLAVTSALVFLILVVGAYTFRRTERTIVDLK